MTEKKQKVQKRLTIAELRNCKGFEEYSAEQAEQTIKSLEKLSILFYELYMKQKADKVSLIKNDSLNLGKTTKNKKRKLYEGNKDDEKRGAA